MCRRRGLAHQLFCEATSLESTPAYLIRCFFAVLLGFGQH
ncbi:hypothetical protein C4K01_1140 [Pseudomonas synxantha]|nr:hypothetical protein C4K01_1140 [Pseudomonas synxantha]